MEVEFLQEVLEKDQMAVQDLAVREENALFKH